MKICIQYERKKKKLFFFLTRLRRGKIKKKFKVLVFDKCTNNLDLFYFINFEMERKIDRKKKFEEC